ncbi:flagellar hook-length control protein FliK [Palleronia sp. KMU-117]|uniref:flagellar hook-length control protein FliK n=1 Tax=Palleronia sp. KMU-117 TaxID=3434108 RepID=UPI003D74D2BD
MPDPTDIQSDRPMAAEMPGSDGSASLREIPTPEPRAGDGRPLADPPMPRPEVARAAVNQITDIAGRLADGPVEISLSPEELGKVRLSLHGGEGQMTVQIMAERPETLDLLRRHIDMLAADLRQQGYANLSFTFGGGDAGGAKQRFGSAPRTDPSDEAGGVAPSARAAAPGPTPSAATGALDLRL